MVKSRMKTRRL